MRLADALNLSGILLAPAACLELLRPETQDSQCCFHKLEKTAAKSKAKAAVFLSRTWAKSLKAELACRGSTVSLLCLWEIMRGRVCLVLVVGDRASHCSHCLTPGLLVKPELRDRNAAWSPTAESGWNPVSWATQALCSRHPQPSLRP